MPQASSVEENSLPTGWFFEGDITEYRRIYEELIPEGGYAAEIGCYRGRSLACVADIIKRKNIHVTAVDLFTPQLEGETGLQIMQAMMALVDERGLKDNINIIRGASVAAADQYRNEYFDFVFLDADHGYRSVQADIDAWAPKLKPNGHMGGHDYWAADPGVVKAVDERFVPMLSPDSSIWLVDASRIKPLTQTLIKLGIGLPAYGPGGVGTIPLVNARESKNIKEFALFEPAGSALTLGFNSAWCWALNGYREGHLTHFLMMHSDVRPIPREWLDLLIDQMYLADCDVLSAIIPIKDGRGLTSTALESDHDRWRPIRITQRQVHKLPATWTCDRLLINTGLMLVKLGPEWTTKDGDARVYFHIDNAICRDENGVLTPRFEPEDWRFSREIRQLGFSQYVTRAVDVQHHGHQAFPSSEVWGWETDQENSGKDIEDEITVIDTDQNSHPFNPFSKDEVLTVLAA